MTPSKASNPSNGGSLQTKSHVSTRVISGSVGSILTSLAVTPLEVAKVRTQQRPSKTGLCPRGCGKQVVLFNGHLDCFISQKSMLPLAEQQPRNGVFSVLRGIFAKEGFRGLYAGLEPTLAMAIPNTVLYFSAYDEIIWGLRESSSPMLPWMYPLVAGASARLVASSVTSPFEFLRTRQATEQGQVASQGLWRDLRTIIRKEGFGTLYSGLRPTLYRDVPFSAIYWFCLEEFRLYWRQTQQQATPTPLEQAGQAFLNGAAAGMIAAAFTTPFDVVKTLQQTNGLKQQPERPPVTSPVQLSLCKHGGAMVYDASPNKANTATSRSTTLTVMREILQSEGWSGLWRGNQARMLKVAPSCAIMLSSYELGKRLLEE